jgi:hypothetical protein
MVLHGCVKTKLNVIFSWEVGGFHIFFVIGQLNGSSPKKKKKKHQNICALRCTTTNLIN